MSKNNDENINYEDVRDQPVDTMGAAMAITAKNKRIYIINDNERQASFTTLAGRRIFHGEMIALDEDEAGKWISSGLASYVTDNNDE